MSYQAENLEKNMVKLTITCTAEQFDAAIVKAYEKNKNKINIQGFRKGKAPLNMVAKLYGYEMFYEDAANSLIPTAYEEAAKESGIEIVSRPEIDVTQIEKGKDFIFTATVAKKPEVTLGEYKGVSVDKIEISVSDSEIDAEIEKERQANGREITVTDRAVISGDTAVIDFEGFCDGVAFEGGKGENYSLVIGSGTFIPGFEDQLIGLNTGDSKDVEVTFPEQYQEASLAGKPATFKCTVKEIKAKELPEVNDEFASEVSEYETLADYKEGLKKQLTEKKEKDAKNAKEDAAVAAAVKNASMEIPDAMIEDEAERMVQDYAYRLQSQGLSMEQFFQYTNGDMKSFTEQMKPQAQSRIENRLVLEAVVKAENITVTEDDMAAELQNMATMYNMELSKVEEIIGEEGRKSIEQDLACQKAVKFIAENAVEA